jgi:transcriptional regulator with GAF, ATPase, and Fis domain
VELIKQEVLGGRISFEDAERDFEKDIILEALKKSNFVQTKAADLLGISRRILKYKMDKYGIPGPPEN